MPDDLDLDPARRSTEAQRLLDHDLPFHAQGCSRPSGRRPRTRNADCGRAWPSSVAVTIRCAANGTEPSPGSAGPTPHRPLRTTRRTRSTSPACARGPITSSSNSIETPQRHDPGSPNPDALMIDPGQMTVLPMFPSAPHCCPGKAPAARVEPRFPGARPATRLTATEVPSSALLHRAWPRGGGGDVRNDGAPRCGSSPTSASANGRTRWTASARRRIRIVRWLGPTRIRAPISKPWPVRRRVACRTTSSRLTDKITELYILLTRIRSCATIRRQAPPRLFDVPSAAGDHLYALASWVPMGQRTSTRCCPPRPPTTGTGR